MFVSPHTGYWAGPFPSHSWNTGQNWPTQVTIGDYPQQITKDVTFLIVDCSSAYNSILGRPNLNSWKAITSTYHLIIKFSTEYGVGEVRGDQVAACECYIAMLEMNDH